MHHSLSQPLDDTSKTREQLLEEIANLRAEIALLKQSPPLEEGKSVLLPSTPQLTEETPKIQPLNHHNGHSQPIQQEKPQLKNLEFIHNRDFSQVIYDEATDAIFLVDPKSLKILDCNQRAVEMFEVDSKAELIGIEGRSLQKRDFSDEEIQEIVFEMQRFGYWTGDIEYLSKKGRHFWGNLSAKNLNISGNTVNLVRVKDINIRKQAEIKLQKREKMLSEAQQVAQIGNWEYDLITQKITWSAQLFQTLGWDAARGEPSYEQNLGLYHPDDAVLLDQAVQRAMTTGEPYELILRVISRGESWSYIRAIGKAELNNKGEIVRLFGTAQDVTEIITTEEALKDSERKFRAIFNNTFQFIGLLSPDGTLLEANQTALDFAGLKREDVVGLPFWEAYWWRISKKTQVQLQQAIARARRGEFIRYEVEVWGNNQVVVPIDFSLRPLRDESGEVILLIPEGRDISEQKRAEFALHQLNQDLELRVEQRTAAFKQSQALLREAQKIANLGIWELNVLTGQVVWSPEIFQMFGFETQTQAPHYEELLQYFLPDERERFTQLINRSILCRETYSSDLQIVRQDGSLGYIYAKGQPMFNEQGEVINLFGIAMDISDRKQAEAHLQEFNRRWRSVLDNIQMIVVELDQQGKVEYVNPYYLKLTQFCPNEVIGKNWFKTCIPTYLQRDLAERFRALLKDQDLPAYTENPILLKSQQERIIAWNNSVLNDPSGKPIGVIAIGEDITERYRLEQMKSEFVSVVSHELRTPLTSIQAALSLLHEKIINPVSEEGETTLSIATEGIDRLVRLVNDILDLERLRSGKLRLEKHPCDTQKIVKDAIAQVRELANQAETEIQADIPVFSLYADEDRLIQVLINLLSNAIKFSPECSLILLAVENIPFDPSEPYAASYLQFTVSDRGRGIPSHNLQSIFEPFQQVDASDSREKGGTGLGLAICRDIIQEHGGRIWVESELGKGSTFYFTIPAEPPLVHW
ncbi:MAG: PAS domain S-box protein [Snowella sp.]|nr:PAS domain S-box protein [Snowella sp.]